MTKREDVTKQGSCKILWRKLRLRGSLLLVLIQFLGGGVRVVAFLSLSWSGREVGWGGRLFEAGSLLCRCVIYKPNTNFMANGQLATSVKCRCFLSHDARCCEWLAAVRITHIVRFLTILDLVALFRSFFYLMIEHLHVVVFPFGCWVSCIILIPLSLSTSHIR